MLDRLSRARDPLYLRRCVVRIYWEGEEQPSVQVPVGDFFGVGHAKVASYSCAVMNMSANRGDDRHAAMNCYWPMPFARGARITIENQATNPPHDTANSPTQRPNEDV